MPVMLQGSSSSIVIGIGGVTGVNGANGISGVNSASGAVCYLSPRTPLLAAMSIPATGLESTYRNSMKDVARMLHSKHQNHYMVGIWLVGGVEPFPW